MLTKLIGHTIKAIKIYKPTHGKRIFGYNAGDMKEKLINTSETNFVIYIIEIVRYLLWRVKIALII